MEVTNARCAGIDVHKKGVTVCILLSVKKGKAGEVYREVRSFGTMTKELLALADWLHVHEVGHVAMESTGEYWKPVYNILEGEFTVLVVNARIIKHVPGRKTDVKDAEWIADLLRHGLLKGSYIPPRAQRDVRDLTRQRTNLVGDRATVINRLQKVLEWGNIKLAAVASDISGVSARRMLDAIVAGNADPQVLAALAVGRLREKQSLLESALQGNVREHHRFMLASALSHIDFLDEQIAHFDHEIAQRMAEMTQAVNGGDADGGSLEGSTPHSSPIDDASSTEWAQAVALLDTVPGISIRSAEAILSEIGVDMQRFASADALASWCKVAPGNNESAGKQYSGRTGKGNRWLRSVLVQVAHAGVRKKNSDIGALYHRIAARRGAKRATIAVAHHVIVAIYHMLTRKQPYQDKGANYYDERHRDQVIRRTTKRLERLGVVLSPVTP